LENTFPRPFLRPFILQAGIIAKEKLDAKSLSPQGMGWGLFAILASRVSQSPAPPDL
jgi:hypothetical protein